MNKEERDKVLAQTDKAKKRANELVDLFADAWGIKSHPETIEIAKGCALIAADELKHETDNKRFYMEVKAEIRKL